MVFFVTQGARFKHFEPSRQKPILKMSCRCLIKTLKTSRQDVFETPKRYIA